MGSETRKEEGALLTFIWLIPHTQFPFHLWLNKIIFIKHVVSVNPWTKTQPLPLLCVWAGLTVLMVAGSSPQSHQTLIRGKLTLFLGWYHIFKVSFSWWTGPFQGSPPGWCLNLESVPFTSAWKPPSAPKLAQRVGGRVLLTPQFYIRFSINFSISPATVREKREQGVVIGS